jgi:hypothetical protein
LEVEWIPRGENYVADYLSKIVEKDDWGISTYILSIIQSSWGNLEVDFFASKHNAKLQRFYSRFWCKESEGVDAFTYPWTHSFGLFVPPIILIPRVLLKMQSCGAKGVLIVPEWKSANFWPMIWTSDGHFKSFVIDYMELPTAISYYIPCKNGSGLFGVENLKFRMLALLISFVNHEH